MSRRVEVDKSPLSQAQEAGANPKMRSSRRCPPPRAVQQAEAFEQGAHHVARNAEQGGGFYLVAIAAGKCLPDENFFHVFIDRRMPGVEQVAYGDGEQVAIAFFGTVRAVAAIDRVNGRGRGMQPQVAALDECGGRAIPCPVCPRFLNSRRDLRGNAKELLRL
jgi:hypothetical protein